MRRLTTLLALLVVLMVAVACGQQAAVPAPVPTSPPVVITAPPVVVTAPPVVVTAPPVIQTAPPKVVVATPSTKGATQIKFTLDFAIQGPQAPFLVALDKGYFAQEGLSVVIDRGLGSADAVTKIASGVYNMGYADINSMMEFNVKNPDRALQVVAMVLDKAPFSLLTLKKTGIASAKDLEGKKLGAPAGDAPRRLFPLFARAANIDASKVTWVSMDAPLREPTLIKGDVDAITGFYFTAYLNLTAAKVAPEDIVALKYSDLGLDLYANGIMASPTWLAANEDAAKAFLRAFMKGMQDTVKNPDEAIDILRKREPLLDKEVEKQRLQLALKDNILTPDVMANGFGLVKADKLAKNIDAVVAGFELPTKPDAAKIFTDKYLPAQADRMPPK